MHGHYQALLAQQADAGIEANGTQDLSAVNKNGFALYQQSTSISNQIEKWSSQIEKVKMLPTTKSTFYVCSSGVLIWICWTNQVPLAACDECCKGLLHIYIPISRSLRSSVMVFTSRISQELFLGIPHLVRMV